MRVARPNTADSTGALVLLAVDLWFNAAVQSPTPPMAWSAAFLAGSTLPLGWRRLAPVPVLGIVGTVVVAGTVAGVAISEAGVLVALYTVGSWRPRSVAVRCLVGFGLAKVAAELVAGFVLSWIPVLLILYCTAVVLGDQQRANRELAAQEQQARARLAAAAERSRIARELHDVVAHTVSVMVLYASVARRAVTSDPGRADAALAQVEASGRESLAELRRLLGALRTEPADLAPHASLDNLDDLVARCVAADLPVRLSVAGNRRPLPAGVELCAYRIVQEALTNAAKHAKPTKVTVDLDYRDAELRIDVRNDGPGRGGGDPGHGLIGMRERAALVGGAIDIRHDPGEFRVTATLPYQG
ncbi:sensor histidine kinase [Actinokineospora sp. UTMC 2448]|uniref:sensor histidine kinase n=1 Tax=Actinokineospora sp. UTMC 2448 TaxID=2268449 RepID=UPI00216470FB|nr:histidine kinase [Actinokineospora sp. UTMC 2448]UVS79087.1 Sensor histidine kinase DesK [Actinokineospora sp. UTMC 2448]